MSPTKVFQPERHHPRDEAVEIRARLARLQSAGAAVQSSTPEARAWHQPFHLRVWKETLYLLLDLPIGVAGFTFVVTGLSLGVSLLITLVGVPLLAATLVLARLAGRAELARSRALLDYELVAPEPLPRRKTVLTRLWAPIRDGSAWRSTAYFALMLPVGIATFTIAVTWWGATLFLVTLPTWAWALPHGGPLITHGYYWSQGWQLALSFVAGLALALATPAVIHAATYLDRGLLALLGRSRVRT
jgi:Putative sensor